MVTGTKSKEEFSLLTKIINGGIAGMVGVSCVFPIDLVKTRLQNQRIGPNGEKLYENIFDCFRKIYRAEGLSGMYRGSLLTILLVTPEKAIKLAGNDFYRHHLQTEDGNLSITRQLLAGGLAGLSQTIISTPLELIKIQLQLASLNQESTPGNELKKITARSIIKKLFREKGILGFFQGIGPTIARDVSFSMMFFPLFDQLISLGPIREDGEIASWCSLLAGFVSGSFTAFAVTPIDVIKTRIQSSLKDTKSNKTGMAIFESISEIYAREGITAFFKGGLCRVVVLAPLMGIAQVIYYLGIGEAFADYF